MSLSPRTAVLLAVVALPLGAAAASYALAEDTVPDVPAQVRIGAVTGQIDPTSVSPPAPPTAATGSVVSPPRPRVVPPAPPVDRDGDDDDADGDDADGDDDGDDGGDDDD